MANDTHPNAPRSRITRFPFTTHSVFTQSSTSAFVPLAGWMSAAGIERVPHVNPFEGKPVRFSVRVSSDEPPPSSSGA